MDFNLDNLDSLFFDQHSVQKYSSKDVDNDCSTTKSLLPRPKATCMPLRALSAPIDDDICLTQAFKTPWKPPPSQSQASRFSLSQMSNFTQQNFNNTESDTYADHPRGPSDRGVMMPGRVGVVAPSQLVRTERVSRPLFKTPAKRPINHDNDAVTSQKSTDIQGSELPMTGVSDLSLGITPVNRDFLMTAASHSASTHQYREDIPQTPNSQDDMFPTQDAFSFTPAPLNLSSITPGGSRRGMMKLRSIEEVPDPYRSIFSFPYFNIVQSKVFDDVFYSDKPIVLCAPTGSGKTVIFELAILRLILTQHGNTSYKSKIVYMAPIKALCSERYEDWRNKFGSLGLTCLELTGDSDIDYMFDLEEVHIILTTPEKWDSMTRRWRNNKSMVQKVRLFLIDEVHTLNDESRGATMEAVISRMKTVHMELTRENSRAGDTMKAIRFVAVSATIPNVHDVGDWLSLENEESSTFNMDDTHRPVHLRKVVLGYPCSESLSEFRFDLSLNYKLAGIVQTYSDQKPTLVFCATRKGTSQAAGVVVKDARFIMNAQHKQRLQKAANSMKDSKLRELIMSGVAFHHAGLDIQDRKTVESMFTQGDVPVLFATSTLAMGVNLPAHLVVVKSTQHYVMGMYREYTETQILQMIGRAGRPQFDTSATAVIMTRTSTKSRYEDLLSGKQMIESSLHQHLIEHLNAEIVLNTIKDVSVALEWAKSTFLYIRMLKNPKHYGLAPGLAKEKVEQHLQELCLKNLNALASFSLVKMDDDFFVLNPTDTGRLMARYCVAFETMKNFHQISGTESLEELLEVFCKSQEFRDVQLRVADKKTLNTLNRDKQRQTIRFSMNGKIKSMEMKVNCLLQSQLSCLTIQDFSLQQDINKINRASLRIVRCLVEILWQRQDQFRAFLNAVLLAKCIKARLWENSKYVTRQLTGIGNMLANALVNAGVTNFQKVEEKNPRDIELIVNRHPPFGRQVKEAVTHLPKYDLCIDQITPYGKETCEITIRVSLANRECLQEKVTADKAHTCVLLIGDLDNNVLYRVRISDALLLREGSWCKKLEVKRAQKGEELGVNLISQDWVGLDVQSSYTPVYIGPKRLGWSSGADANTTVGNKREKVPLSMTTGPDSQPDSQSQQEANFDLVLDDGPENRLDANRKPCAHSCKNKQMCSHPCCKYGIVVREKRPIMMDKFRQQLKHKMQVMPPETPQMKRPKSGLQQYAYTPRLPPLPSMANNGSYTPNPVPGATGASYTSCTITPAYIPGVRPVSTPRVRPMSTPRVHPMSTPRVRPMSTSGLHPTMMAHTPRYNNHNNPPTTTPKGWEGLDLFEKRCNATKEWNYDAIHEEPQIGEGFRDEELIQLETDYRSPYTNMAADDKHAYYPDNYIEDFQGSPELVPQFHREITRTPATTRGSMQSGSQTRITAGDMRQNVDDLPDLRPSNPPTWRSNPLRNSSSGEASSYQSAGSRARASVTPCTISEEFVDRPVTQLNAKRTTPPFGSTQNSMEDFECDEIVDKLATSKRREIQQYQNSLNIRPQLANKDLNVQKTTRQGAGSALARFGLIPNRAPSDKPQSILKKTLSAESRLEMNRNFSELAQKRIQNIRPGQTTTPNTDSGGTGHKIVEKFNPDEFTDSDVEIIGCDLGFDDDVIEIQGPICASDAQRLTVKEKQSPVQTSKTQSLKARSNYCGLTRPEPEGAMNTTADSDELLLSLTEPVIIEAGAPDMCVQGTQSQPLLSESQNTQIRVPSSRSQASLMESRNPNIGALSSRAQPILAESRNPNISVPSSQSQILTVAQNPKIGVLSSRSQPLGVPSSRSQQFYSRSQELLADTRKSYVSSSGYPGDMSDGRSGEFVIQAGAPDICKPRPGSQEYLLTGDVSFLDVDRKARPQGLGLPLPGSRALGLIGKGSKMGEQPRSQGITQTNSKQCRPFANDACMASVNEKQATRNKSRSVDALSTVFLADKLPQTRAICNTALISGVQGRKPMNRQLRMVSTQLGTANFTPNLTESLMNQTTEPKYPTKSVDNISAAHKSAILEFGSMFHQSPQLAADLYRPPVPCPVYGTAARAVPVFGTAARAGPSEAKSNLMADKPSDVTGGSLGNTSFFYGLGLNDQVGAEDEHSGIFQGIF